MHVSRDHKLAGPIDPFIGGRYGDPLRPADSGNVVSADEKGHVLCLANSWIDDRDMGERKAAGVGVNNPENLNSAQSRNRERKINLKRWDRTTKLDTKTKPLVPSKGEAFFVGGQSGCLCGGTLQQFSQIVDINSARVTDDKIAEAAMTPGFHIKR